MGLFIYRVRFESTPPSEAAFRAELRRQVGPRYEVDEFVLAGNVVEITAGLDPVTGPYALKILQDLGGQYVDFGTGLPRRPHLPPYVRQPWSSWPLWKRAGIHARFHLGLLSTAFR